MTWEWLMDKIRSEASWEWLMDKVLSLKNDRRALRELLELLREGWKPEQLQEKELRDEKRRARS